MTPKRRAWKQKKRRPLLLKILTSLFSLAFLKRIIVIGFWTVLAGVLVGLVLLPVVVMALEETQPPEFRSASLLYDREGEEYHHLYEEEYRIYVPLEDMPERLIEGAIAVEDYRFREHFGIDLRGVSRAMLRNIRAGQIVEGGSTISQQLAKNYFLDHTRSWDRKVREFFLTLHLERTLSKNEILEEYLNGIYFGHGAYGVEAASRMYFGKSVKELDLGEMALLVGIPRGPYYYSPYRDMDRAIQRRNTVLDRMEETGIISSREALEAKGTELEITGYTPPKSNAPYFADEVVRRLRQKLPEEYHDRIKSGGLRVRTTLDQDMQTEGLRVLNEELPVERIKSGPDGEEIRQPQGSLVSLRPEDGRVKALVSGRSHSETELPRANPRVPGRAAGSVFKAYVYAAALSERGVTPASTFTCERTEFPPEPGQSEPFVPRDFGGGFHDDTLTVRRAIQDSCNVTAVKVHDMIGKNQSLEYAREMGVTSTHVGPWTSFPLGEFGVTPLEVTASYAPLANQGLAVEPYLIHEVQDSQGRVIYRHEPERAVVLEKQVAYLLTDMLRGVISTDGTARAIAGDVHYPAAGKTGTSQYFKDAVFVGYTPELVTSVFVGDDDNNSLEGTGGSLAAPLWEAYMAGIIEKLDLKEFERPDGIVSEDICQASGKRATRSCPEEDVREEIFLPGTVPTEQCDVHEPEPDGFWRWWEFF